MLSRDLEVRALRLESLKLVQQAENVLSDLRAHQKNLERFLCDYRQLLEVAETGKDREQ